MRREVETGLSGDVPIVLSQWYDTAKWILEKIDKFPKNQRFIFGTRLADRSLGILEGLVQASYSRGPEKVALLETANRDLAVLRWLIRMAKDRQVISPKQYEYCCGRMYECGKMPGGARLELQAGRDPAAPSLVLPCLARAGHGFRLRPVCCHRALLVHYLFCRALRRSCTCRSCVPHKESIMAVTIYYDKDADLSCLKAKKVAVIGYGSQGHAHAQNLRDSGVDVIAAELPGTANHDLATRHKFRPVAADEATRQADLIIMTLPDELQPRIYREQIAPNLKDGKALGFCHGFNIHFGQIVPPAGVDVIMAAPKGPGHLLRSEFERGAGIPSLIAVHADATGKAKQTAMAWAAGIGSGRAGIIDTTFADETETDLFGEQAVLCGGVTELVKAGFETLVEAGYEPEMAFFECMHELKLIVDLFYRGGISYMWYSVSNTAEYGGLTRGRKVIGDEARKAMKRILEDVRDGTFAREWILESQANRPVLNALAKRDHDHPVEQVGRQLRKMMPFCDAVEV